MGYKMKPGSGSSAKNTGRGLAERGLVPDRGPKMHNGKKHDVGEIPVKGILGREGEFVNSKENNYAGGSYNITFDPKTGYKKGKVKVETFGNEKFLDGGNRPYKMNDPKARKAFKNDSIKLDRKFAGEARIANEIAGLTQKKPIL